MDSLLSIVQMPAGVPVATVAIGNARNAGLLAVRILAAVDPGLQQRIVAFPGGRCGTPRWPRVRSCGSAPTSDDGAACRLPGHRARS